MKRKTHGVFLSAALCVLSSILLFAFPAPSYAQDDVVLRAMKDELQRSMQQLQLEQLEKPYFIAYRVEDKNAADVTASFGALLASIPAHIRLLNVEVRVGSPKLDNTNFLSMSFLEQRGLNGGFAGNSMLSTEASYKELRRQLWLATDSAYKRALEDLAHKRAALQNKVTTAEIPDFSRQNPALVTEPEPEEKIEAAPLESLARELSGVFSEAADIFAASAHLTLSQTYTRYVNSEGTAFSRRDPEAAVVLMAETQAKDGAPLRDFITAYGHSLGDLPAESDLRNRAIAMRDRLVKLRNAETLDDYNGPVLFRGEAAAELFAQVMASSMLALRAPTSDMPQFEMLMAQMESPLQNRLGGRVLPNFLSVADDPTLAQFGKSPLLGSRRIDDDGVLTQRTVLVESGTLKYLLATRDPVRGITQSTGSRRGPSAGPSNLFVTASNGLTDQEMMRRLQTLIQQRGLPFGIIVDRLDNPLIGDPQSVAASLIGGFMTGRSGAAPIQKAVSAIKIYQDGHVEDVRNITLQGIDVSAFKDVAAASSDAVVYTTPFFSMRNSVTSLLAGGNLSVSPPPLVSFIVPSLIFEDVGLAEPTQDSPKLPLSPRPVGD